MWRRYLTIFAVSLSVSGGVRPDPHPYEVVLVGGSDGSGTRAVVSLLQRMGVEMIIDDPVTNDLHAAEVGGWPAVVRPLLEAIQRTEGPRHSRDDDCWSIPFPPAPEHPNLPPHRLAETQAAVHRLIELVGRRAQTRTFGIKAPVSMALLPFMVQATATVR